MSNKAIEKRPFISDPAQILDICDNWNSGKIECEYLYEALGWSSAQYKSWVETGLIPLSAEIYNSDLSVQIIKALLATNRRLNRRCQKLERRINRWESGQYTINRWRNWLCAWYRAEKDRADCLEAENKKLKRPSLLSRIFKR